MIVPINLSLTVSQTIPNQEYSIVNQSQSYIKEDFDNNNNVISKNNNFTYKKNKLIKNSHSMPNLLFPKAEKEQSQKTKMDNNQFIKYLKQKKPIPLIELEKNAHEHFINNYIDNDYYNIQKIEEIINNEKSHLVAEFKDFLVLGDIAEFLQGYYALEDIQLIYPQILEYYKENLFIFPNYVILPESKYIYANIQKKQKIIDIQEEIEDNAKMQNNKDDDINDINIKTIFTYNEIESLLNQTDTSGIKQYFGISSTNTENSNGIDKNEQQILKLIDNINDSEKNKNYNFIQKNNNFIAKQNKLHKYNKKEDFIYNNINNNNKIIYKINKNKGKKENKKTNPRNNGGSKILMSEMQKNEMRFSNKRNNLSQPNLKNQSNTFNTVIINSINNKNNYIDNSKNNKYKKESKTKEIKESIRQNNKNQIIEKIHQKHMANKIFKKFDNKNNSLSNENITNNINNNITEITKLNKIMKINKNILNEINNYQNNKKQNFISSIKIKSYKKLLMNVLLSSSMGTLNDAGGTLKTNNSKKILIHINIYNSEADSIRDKFLTSTINGREKSISSRKKALFLKNEKNFIKFGKIEKPKKEKKNKLSSSCKNMSINSYITKKMYFNKKNINFFTNRNKSNHCYKLITNRTNKSNSKKISNKERNIKNNFLSCEENTNIFNTNKNNINKKESKNLLDSYSTKEMSKKFRKSNDNSYKNKNIIDFKILKVIKNKNKRSINEPKKLSQNKIIKKLKNKSPFEFNNFKGLPLTDRKTKAQIDNNLEKIELLSKEIKKIKENLKKSADKIPKISHIHHKKNKSTKIIENNESKKYNNSHNVIKVYLSNKTRNKTKNKNINNNIKVNSSKLNSREYHSGKVLNYAFTFRKMNNDYNYNKKNNSNYQLINSKNNIMNISQKSTMDNFNKTKYNTLINFHKKNSE